MGAKPCICVARLELDCPQPGDRWSCCGSDAFYRDEFLEEEATVGKAGLTGKVWEQALLKSMKGQVFLDYTKFSAAQAATAFKRRFSGEFPAPEELMPAPPSPQSPSSWTRTFSDWTRTSDWVGKTLKEWRKDGLPPSRGAHWKKGDGSGLQVRSGPDYATRRQHAMTPKGHLYDTLTVDALHAPKPLNSILGTAIDSPPPASADCTWTRGCPLPRILCINVMLPHYNPKNPWATDEGGCSYVGFFQITNETVEQAKSEKPPAAVQMFRNFFEGPAGPPGCAVDHPDRTLYRRRDLKKTKDMDSGLLRAAGWCLNPAELGVPEFLHQFNGKSFVIADSGYVIKDPEGEWMEVGFDVRKFPFLFVEVLYNFRDFIPKAKCHYGFTVQAVEDEEMPEGVICDVYMSGLNILDDPYHIDV